MTAEEKIRGTGAQLRLGAMETQIAVAFNFCSTAENAFAISRVEGGRRAIEKARHIADVLRAHLAEPDHVPAASVADFRAQLEDLNERISKLEARFQP